MTIQDKLKSILVYYKQTDYSVNNCIAEIQDLLEIDFNDYEIDDTGVSSDDYFAQQLNER